MGLVAAEPLRAAVSWGCGGGGPFLVGSYFGSCPFLQAKFLTPFWSYEQPALLLISQDQLSFSANSQSSSGSYSSVTALELSCCRTKAAIRKM